MKRLFMRLLVAVCVGLALACSEPHLQTATPKDWLRHNAPELADQLALIQNTATPTERPPARDVPYAPTPSAVVAKMLAMADVGSEDIVYDLGSGDGRIVIAAVRDFHAQRGVGIDIDPQRIEEANQNAQEAGVTDRVTFREGDIFEEDFSEATVVTLYLLSSVNLRLRPRLLEELSPGTRLVSQTFDMGDWKPDQHEVVNVYGWKSNVYFWRIPANVTGTWQVQLDGDNGQQDYTLELEQQFQTIAGTLREGSRQVALADGQVAGETVTFTLTPPGQEAWRFTGTVKENTITGTLKRGDAEHPWQAEREPATRRPLEKADEESV
jgi:precorrin-6B methylase 2